MKQRSLKIFALVCLFVLLAFTGCSATGGMNGCMGGCIGTVFEKLGCTIDCLIKFEPVYCLTQNCSVCTDDYNKPVSCDDCYEGCLVTPCFVCANENRSSCINKNKENEDIDYLLGGTFGDASKNWENESYESLGLIVSQTYTGSSNATCDGDYQRCETTITVKNAGTYVIKNAFVEITKGSTKQSCVIGTIRPGQEAEGYHYQFFREESSPDYSLEGATFTLYGTVTAD